jgi:hypothetical protein
VYQNSAFDNMRADDAFWAARIVSKFTDADISAIVGKARYSDPRATDYITGTLIERRNRVLKTWLTTVNPLVDFELSADGQLTFNNAAVAAGVASPVESYRVHWARFDNASGSASGATEITTTDARVAAPSHVLAGAQFVQIEIASLHPHFPAWNAPVTVHFRRDPSGWTLVGVKRLQ